MGALSSSTPTLPARVEGHGSARAQNRAVLIFVLCALGAVARGLSVFLDPPMHPDEFFQYLEPAYMHLTGVGVEPWEFRDGLRSWVLPFYNGAWLSAFMAVGVSRGETLVRLVQLQGALVNAVLVWVAYRGGASCTRKLLAAPYTEQGAGFAGGAFAAFLCASFPLLVIYAGHTLSELPSLLFLLAGFVQVSELTEDGVEPALARRKAAVAGALLSFGACLRIANGPLVLVAPLWLLITRRYGALAALTLAALVPALLFGLVDLLTWGTFAHSYVEYVKFNFVEGKAANFGTAPASYYLEFLAKRAPYAGGALFLAACFGVRRNFIFFAPLLLGLGYLSTQPHKEERFILFVWPLLFVAAGAVLGAAFTRARAAQGKALADRLRFVLPLVLALATPLDGAWRLQELRWLGDARFLAETVVGDDPSLTGLLIDAPIFAGGALWLGTRAPHMDVAADVLPNPLITHVVVASDSANRARAEAAGFKPLRHVKELLVLRRLPPPAKR
jgi:phosphatidylinositol glycan class B